MSIADKLTRLAAAREDIIDALGNKGVTATDHGIEDFATDIASITGGGAGGIVITDTTDTAGGTIRTITAVSLDNDTVTANDLLNGVTAHDSTGTAVTGNIATKTVSDLTASGDTVTVPAGYYASQATKSVSAGTAGTPSATKGTVSNHSVSVTPSVTNTSGYITGSTKTGTAVTVTASELASGNKEITANGTNIDVVGYSTVSVNVSGGGSSKNVQYVMGSKSVHTNGYTSTDMSITVAKTGTYNVSWVGWRSSSQGTMGTCLYKNGTAGTTQQTFTNTYGQCVTLTNQSYTQGDVLTLYATAGSTTRYMWVANLIIEEQ